MGCSPWGRWESDTTERLHFHFSLSCIGEGNGNPLHCSCLENPRDRGAWWAAVWGHTESDTTEATQQQQSIAFSRALGLAPCLRSEVAAQAGSLLGVLSVVLLCCGIRAEDPW